MSEATPPPEACPWCRKHSALRRKLLLIDEAWNPGADGDPRDAWFADLRVDDVEPARLRAHPLEQFVDGYYCDDCGRGFVAEDLLAPDSRRLRSRFRLGGASGD